MKCQKHDVTPPGLWIRNSVGTKKATQILISAERRLLSNAIGDLHHKMCNLARKKELILEDLSATLSAEDCEKVLSLIRDRAARIYSGDPRILAMEVLSYTNAREARAKILATPTLGTTPPI